MEISYIIMQQINNKYSQKINQTFEGVLAILGFKAYSA